MQLVNPTLVYLMNVLHILYLFRKFLARLIFSNPSFITKFFFSTNSTRLDFTDWMFPNKTEKIFDTTTKTVSISYPYVVVHWILKATFMYKVLTKSMRSSLLVAQIGKKKAKGLSNAVLLTSKEPVFWNIITIGTPNTTRGWAYIEALNLRPCGGHISYC